MRLCMASEKRTYSMRLHEHLLLTIYFALSVTSLQLANGQNVSAEVSSLLQIKSVLGNSGGDALTSWSAGNALCTWKSIQWTFSNGTLLDCSSSALKKNLSLSADPSIAAFAISLPDSGLNGSIPSQFAELASLRSLNLSSNNLTGGIPLNLGSMASLETLSLSGNELSGAIPASIWGLCGQLQELHLDHNTFSGGIPSPASLSNPCLYFRKLDLNDNILSGSIPSFIGSFANLTELNLSNNNLSGAIPESFSQLNNLAVLDIANNNLSGAIPAVKGAGAMAYAGNPLLCGAPLTNACAGQGVGEEEKKGLDKRLVAALVIGTMAIAVVALAIAVGVGHRHNWGRGGFKGGKLSQEMLAAEDDIGDGKLVRFEGGEHLNVEEVLNAPGEVLGKTSYGTVYKAKLGGGAMIALRLLREDTVKDKEQFTPAIQQLGLIRYPNVVSLLAYYAGPKGEKLLVYNYLSRGSLADLLYNRSLNRSPLSWARRHKIVLGAARGLAHLHHGTRTQIVHGNLKSKNVMVDESFEGHLADYGLALLMNTGAQNEMINAAAAQGYKAPELAKMSRANTTTDVYSFGIVLLEILTGKKPRESDGPDKLAVDLPTTVKAAVIEERISDLFDLEIITGMRSPLEDGLVQTLQLAMGCCAPSPAVRPDIKEVVRQLEEIRPKIPTPLYTPTGMKSPRDFTT
ncbi:hypothetical protein GOP47_0009890 [Adiantum capillus-veneris]|uniref:Protein kinase domain-containing protein n=1 Tax=Adiantum capillus-veneris TaxID=13818 RepID=A0A9D4UXG7_ADICA|nr:hypothetical protein GOP47_0009890 [Adiantum capillus-veneris]